MMLLRKFKHACGRLLYSLAETFPLSWKKKLAIILAVMRHDWRLVRFLGQFSADIGTIGVEEIDSRFAGLDAESIAAAKKYVGKSFFSPWLSWVTAKTPHQYHAWAGLCSEEDFRKGEQDELKLEALRSQYHFSDGHGEPSSLFHNHGLANLSPSHKTYLVDKVFIDAGAFIGDSALPFLAYSPFKIFAFEPSPTNRKRFVDMMALNHISADRVVLVDKGLSNNKGIITFSEDTSGTSLRSSGICTAELTTLDDFVRESTRPIGFIKADVEGMGLDLLKGAMETLKRDRPILSLSIYHNKEEFFGIYELLKSIDLGYQFKIVSLCAPWENNELTLLALPNLQ